MLSDFYWFGLSNNFTACQCVPSGILKPKYCSLVKLEKHAIVHIYFKTIYYHKMLYSKKQTSALFGSTKCAGSVNSFLENVCFYLGKQLNRLN